MTAANTAAITVTDSTQAVASLPISMSTQITI